MRNNHKILRAETVLEMLKCSEIVSGRISSIKPSNTLGFRVSGGRITYGESNKVIFQYNNGKQEQSFMLLNKDAEILKATGLFTQHQ